MEIDPQQLQQIFDLLFVACHCFAAMKGWQAGSTR